MGNSLQDQLLKLGLVDEKQAKQNQQERRKQSKQQRHQGKDPDAERRREANAAQARKAERDRELNRKRQEEAERKALRAQIKQMIEASRLPKDGEIAFNFTDGQKIKRIYVSADVHAQLTAGRCALVKLQGQYHVVPLDAAEKIRERDANCVISLQTAQENAEDDPEDDPYADYQVPDDLMW